jgi:hypothetical protein
MMVDVLIWMHVDLESSVVFAFVWMFVIFGGGAAFCAWVCVCSCDCVCEMDGLCFEETIQTGWTARCTMEYFPATYLVYPLVQFFRCRNVWNSHQSKRTGRILPWFEL